MKHEYEFTDRYRNTTAGHAVDYPSAELAPESDAKMIRQQVIGLTENMREVRYQLGDVADRFWGSMPSEVASSDKPEISGDTLRGVNQELDEARSELSRLKRAAERFRRLA